MPDTRPATLYDVITSEAQAAKVPPELALAVAQHESGFDPQAQSQKGAQGIFQLMPETAKALGVADPADPVQNIRGGVQYLRQQLEASGGDVSQALARYNYGPGHVARGAALPPETTDYIQKVMQETAFRQWYGQRASALKINPNPDDPQHFYDYRAAHAAGAEPDATGHWPSQFKREGHPNLIINGVDTRTGLPAGTQPGEEGPPAVGQPPPAPPAPPEQKSYLRQLSEGMLSSFDPRTPEGRRNLAGGAGAIAGGVLAPATGGLSILIPALGAAAGGMLAETGEQLVGAPPPGGISAGSIAKAGAEQTAYELGGRAMLWPLRTIGRRLVATRVGKYAAESLGRQKVALSAQLDAGLQAAKDLLRGTKAGARQEVSKIATGARAGVEAAKTAAEGGATRAAEQGAAGVTKAGEEAAAGEAAAQAPYEQMVGAPPPSPAQAGRAANEVIQAGGAARARDLLGQAVDKSAESGPDVDIRELKAQARQILEKQIQPPAEAFPRKPPVDLTTPEAISAQTGIAPEQVAKIQQAAAAGDARAIENLDTLQQAVSMAQAEAGQEMLKHPAVGVLGRILNAGDTVSFKDAHLFKRELDEAIGNTWDRSTRKQVTNVTKTLRGQLRSALAVHAPYNEATAAYAKVAPLYSQGIAPKLRKLATEAPEAIVRLIDPKKPTNVTMLRDLLVHQAAEGGDAAGGQAAWDGVRSAWTNEKLIKGGLDGLGKRLDAVEGQPEFHGLFFGDDSGKAIWQNLRTIQAGYEKAIQAGEEGVTRAKVAGKAGETAAGAIGERSVQAARETGQRVVGAVREAGAQKVEQAQAGLEAARTARRTGLAPITQQQRELAASSVARSARAGASGATTGDVLRAMMLGPGTRWGAISMSHLMHGPTAEELVHWAALSPQSTQRLVWALTSSTPAIAVADLARSSGILGGLTESQIGRPPAKPAAPAPGVGQPPPGPARRPGELYITMSSGQP